MAIGNALGSSDLEKDLELARGLEIDSILFPHIESAKQVAQAKDLLDSVNPKLEFRAYRGDSHDHSESLQYAESVYGSTGV